MSSSVARSLSFATTWRASTQPPQSLYRIERIGEAVPTGGRRHELCDTAAPFGLTACASKRARQMSSAVGTCADPLRGSPAVDASLSSGGAGVAPSMLLCRQWKGEEVKPAPFMPAFAFCGDAVPERTECTDHLCWMSHDFLPGRGGAAQTQHASPNQTCLPIWEAPLRLRPRQRRAYAPLSGMKHRM
jgi:hypothetical protein